MLQTNSFSRQYRLLNLEQKRAVDAIEGPVMVIAGPGTGKTQILTLRIAQILLKTQVNPENILALTFTENAATEMKQRLSELIGADALKVSINTFHGFCNELIQKHFDIFHHLVSFLPISDLEEIEIVQDIITSEPFAYLRPVGDPSYYLHPIRQAISSLKKEGISPDQFSKAVEKWGSDFEKRDDLIHTTGRYKGNMKGSAIDEQKHIEKNREFGRVFQRYEEKMKEKKLYDFNDMIMEVIRAFQKNEQFLAQMRETYQYILIDEHQDTNNAQNTIIEYLCKGDDFPNLFVVGDEKQSIFRFQGASLENFLYFQKAFPRAVLVQLSHNYRSTQNILDLAGSFIQHNPHSISAHTRLLSAGVHPEVSIKLTTYDNPHQEFAEIVKKIQKLQKEGVPFEEVAILVRKNIDLLTMGSLLEKETIPYVLSTEESLFSEGYIQKFITLLEAIFFIGDDTYLSKVLLVELFHLDPLDVFHFIQAASKKRIALWELFRDEKLMSAISFYDKKSISRFVEQLIKWKKQSENDAIDEFFISLLNTSGFMEQILGEKDALFLLEKFHLLYEDLKQLQRKNHSLTLKDYIYYIALVREHAIPLQKKVSPKRIGSVFVSTVHKSKGLEFSYVFIPKVTDSYWGNGRGQNSLIHLPWKYLSRTDFNVEKEEMIEEERRLFYVALTRAKKQIILSLSRQNEEGKGQVMSSFLHEMPQTYIHVREVKETDDDVEKRIAQVFSLPTSSSTVFRKSDMREYIRSLYIANGVSVSALNNFLTCPWKYLFRNLIRLPAVRGYYLLLGTAVHETIREYISHLKKGAPLSEKELLYSFEQLIQHVSASERDIFQLKEKGSLIIQSYFQKRMKYWADNRESELIIPNMYLDDDISINGKIDMIEYGGKNKSVIVYDFKTGKPKSRNTLLGNTKAGNKDYYRQLVFYQLLLSLYKKGQYQMKEGIIEFVESALTGEIKNETFVIDRTEVSELITTIKQMRDSVLSLSFWDSRCDDTECEYCRLRSFFIAPWRESGPYDAI